MIMITMYKLHWMVYAISISILSSQSTEISKNKNIPSHFNIAGQVPLILQNEEPDKDSLAIQQAILMAINEINDKTDGIHDYLLPYTELYISIRDVDESFENGVYKSLELIDSFGDNERLTACIGPDNYDALRGGSKILSDHHVFQIGYSDRNSALGMSDIYPNSLRTVPGYYVDGRVIADFVQFLGWERVSVFSTSDTYGNMATFFFEKEAEEVGIKILSLHHMSRDTEDFSSHIEDAKKAGAKVFVFLMASTPASVLLSQGYKLGLFNADTAIVANEYAATVENWAHYDSDLLSLVSGFISISYHELPEESSGKSAFLQRFRGQPHTLGEYIDGVHVCNNSTDDTGYFLYQVGDICTGLNHSLYAVDGSDLPPAAYHAYDATYAVAFGLHDLVYEKSRLYINDEELRSELLLNTRFHGATGNVGFSTKHIEDGFDVGSRDSGLTFDVLNFDKSFSVKSPVLVGSYHSDWGIELCDGCVITYAGDTTKPLDRPEPHVEHLNPVLVGISLIISICALTLSTIYSVMFYVYRRTRLIRATQPAVYYVVLSGCFLGGIRAITALIVPTTGLCMSQMWIAHLSFTLVFSSLLVKVWKIYKVVNASLKRVKLSTAHTLHIVMFSTSPVILYLLFISSMGSVEIANVLVHEDQHRIEYQKRCDFELHDELNGLYILELMCMLYGLYLCYLVKDIPEALSNYRTISKCIVHITCLAVTFFSILYSLNLNPNENQCLVSVAFALAIITTLDQLFRNTCINLLMGKDMTKSFRVEKGMHRSIVEIWNGVPISPAEVGSDVNIDTAGGNISLYPTIVNIKDRAALAKRKKELTESIEAMKRELGMVIEAEMYSYTSSGSTKSSQHNNILSAVEGPVSAMEENDTSSSSVKEFC
mmetsp:Transcript_24360/g.35740  ORF Transcript_24360/g.35740 Transcript_24360/m.35740 type:complete len:884 (-) Transcript_24360:202-2853(-)